MKVTEIKIVKDYCIKRLEKKVNRLLKEGYESDFRLALTNNKDYFIILKK